MNGISQRETNGTMKSLIVKIRQFLLKNFIPEFIWPKNVILNGVKIPVRHMDFSFGNKLNLCKGVYEYPERKLLGFLVSGMNVVEFGSSIGILSAIISEKIGDTGKLVSVEASPKLVLNQLKWLCPIRKNIIVLQGYAFPVNVLPRGLSVQNFDSSEATHCGKVDFCISASGEKNNLFDISSINTPDRYFDRGVECLICDIEGSEEIIAEYGFNMPKSLAHILIELHPWMYKEKETVNKIIDNIKSAGFRLMDKEADTYYFARQENYRVEA